MSEQIPPLSIIVMRHGKKEPKQVIPCSSEDRELDLTQEGKATSFSLGKEAILEAPSHDYVWVATSDFKRTKTTAQQMLLGAGYDTCLAAFVEDASIGFTGVDWTDPHIPNPEVLGQNLYVEQLLAHWYRPRKECGNQLSMARYAAAMLNGVIAGVEHLIGQQSNSGLVLIATHGVVIDAFASVVFGYLSLDKAGMNKVVNYPGAFRMGEYIKGCVEQIGEYPLVKFRFERAELEISLSLTELRDRRGVHYNNSL